MNRILAISISVAVVMVCIISVYFFVFYEQDSLQSQKDKIEESLALASKKLNAEKQNLDSLQKALQESFPLAVTVQGQMKKSFDVVKSTDFMFSDPYGVNPQLIVQGSASSLLLSNERKNINALLLRWEKQLDLLALDKINISESEKIKKDIETIKNFIKNISQVVKDLTPENSGLTQYQIETYSTQFASTNNIDEILTSIENAIKNPGSIVINTDVYNSIGNEIQNPTINNQASNNDTGQNPMIVDLFTNNVLPTDVFAAQLKVEEAQQEVNALAAQLAQIEAQLQQSNNTGNTPTPEAIPVVIDPPIITENVVDDGGPGIERIKYEGILVQPGPPRLIQGSDAY